MKNLELINLRKNKLLNSPFLQSFDQESMLKQYNQVLEPGNQLNIGGNCFGLCMDYTRHIESHRNINTPHDYKAKLEKKSTIISPNFGKRIAHYQNFLQLNLKHKPLRSSNEITSLISSSDNHRDIIGLSFHTNSLAESSVAHIIAIEPVLDNHTQKLQGFRIFDPNFGIFDTNNNINMSIEIMTDLMDFYNAHNLVHTKTINLSKKVAQYSLIKQADEGINHQYSKDQKYLDGNTKLAEKDLYSVLKYAIETNNHQVAASIIQHHGNEFSPIAAFLTVSEALKKDDFTILRNLYFYGENCKKIIDTHIKDDTSKKFEPFLKALILVCCVTIASRPEFEIDSLNKLLQAETKESLIEFAEQMKLISNHFDPVLISKVIKLLPQNITTEHRVSTFIKKVTNNQFAPQRSK